MYTSRDDIYLSNNQRSRFSAIFVLIFFSILLFLLFLYHQQNFICNKQENVCYSTMSGLKIIKLAKMNDISTAKIIISTAITSSNRVSQGYEYGQYMPVLVLNNGTEIPFFKTPVDKIEIAQIDLSQFNDFLDSDKDSLNIKNSNNNFVYFASKFSLILIIFVLFLAVLSEFNVLKAKLKKN